MAQNNPRPQTARMKQDLDRATSFMTSNKLDSANLLCKKLLAELGESGQVDGPFGLQLQMVYGTVLNHKDLDTAALRLLLHVKETSKTTGQWETFAETCRELASLHEKIGRADQSLLDLRLAQTAIAQHGLDSIYPRFAIRISSWHRIFGDKDSSLFYATEALRTAPLFGQVNEEAEAHLLLGMLSAGASPEKSMVHFNAAKAGYQKVEDYTILFAVFLNISKLHIKLNDLPSALAYNDSVMVLEVKARTEGEKWIDGAHLGYKQRGEIYQAMGMPDSALFYWKKGYEMELEYVQDVEKRKVVEIDARYQDDKKTALLEERDKDIRHEKERRNWILAAFFILLLFAALLAHYYRRLQKANRITETQSVQLKTLDVAKSHFFANVSHELRTPLTLLLGPIKTLLKENQLTEKQSRLLQMANHSGKELQQLVNEILDLQKLEMGKMELYEKPTQLSLFFNRYNAQFESLAYRKKIDFSIETTVGDEVMANIDQEKCRQIIYNLLSNAFKFTPPGGQVKVDIELLGYWDTGQGAVNNPISQYPNIQISISDSGPGIHPDDLPHVFDRFFQTTRPEKPAEGGTGIGLALCQEYAHLFGGKIEVESPDPRSGGKGTIMRVTFPIKVLDSPKSAVHHPQANELGIVAAVEPVKESRPSTTSGKPKQTILVVEDNPGLQDYIRLVLEEKYQVVTAENGQTALQKLTANSQQPMADLILSDLMMPVMDGYQLLEKLKSNDATRHIPVIMLTARAELRDKLKALRIGVDDYMTKPFDEEELLVRIKNLLRNQAARRQEIPTTTEQEAAAAPGMSEADRTWLETFESHVQKHLTDDTFNVPMLAHAFTMSESTLLRQLKRLTGLSPVQYLQEMRLDHARHLLENRSHDSIAKVAAEVGYNDPRFFSRSFKKRFGKSPAEFLSN